MPQASFAWTIPPDASLIPAIRDYEQRILHGLWLLADLFAQKMQGEARSNAPWNDVTGAARGGLLGQAVKSATEIIVYLLHSVEYGPYLEMGTSKMAPRPILLPTLEANYPEVMNAVRKLLAG